MQLEHDQASSVRPGTTIRKTIPFPADLQSLPQWRIGRTCGASRSETSEAIKGANEVLIFENEQFIRSFAENTTDTSA